MWGFVLDSQNNFKGAGMFRWTARGKSSEPFPEVINLKSYQNHHSTLLSLTSIVFGKMQALSRCARPALQAAVRRQSYSTSTGGYAATAENLRINKVRPAF
jgi:hypothetical protein